MRAAIYSRKSRFTGRGESIDNQIQMCREYAVKYLGVPENEFVIFEDEGFSGGNTNRPEFKHMMQEARNKRFDLIICYRLDRISRNVSDFSQLITELEKYNVSFISVREQFDTTKPMGRAMMYVASVFSQLERETIAERIRDNMLQLAKTGRWLGGITPTGYKSRMIVSKDASFKENRMFTLEVVPEEAELVKEIYRKYIKLKSITKVEKSLVQNSITTKRGLDFSRFTIRFILTNPVYAISDASLYKYLAAQGLKISSEASEFNGINGLMAYNKTRQDKSASGDKFRNPKDWVIAVGMHPGLIPGDEWIKVQEMIHRNTSKTYRNVKNSNALLSGILRCGCCGSFMRPKSFKRLDSDGEKVFYYICELKEKSNKTRCSIQNLNGNIVDSQILCRMAGLIYEYFPKVSQHTNMKQPGICLNENSEIHLIKDKLSAAHAQMNNLVRLASKEIDETVQTVLMGQMEKLSKDMETYNRRIDELQKAGEQDHIDKEGMDSLMCSLSDPGYSIINIMNINQKREILKNAFDSITWDGRQIRASLKGSRLLPEGENCK
ncbi:MAG TPA: recombinase family protein [Ruminiclostridium sp.]|nr:recombinase family protein [Ruminiclostridium sp.]